MLRRRFFVALVVMLATIVPTARAAATPVASAGARDASTGAGADVFAGDRQRIVDAESTSVPDAVPGGPRSLSSCSSFVEIADVSTYQGQIDWGAYATQRPGAIIKLGGADGGFYRDGRATYNVLGATSAGVLWGGYFFANPSTAYGNAEGQADYFVSIGGGTGTLPAQLDLEANYTNMSGDQLDRWALDFAAEYHRLVAHELDLYMGAFFANAGHDPALASTFGLWLPGYLAGYQRNPNPCAIGSPNVPNAFGGKGWDAWQYTSCATAAGVPFYRGGGCSDGWIGLDMSVVPPEVWAEWTGSYVVPDLGSTVPAAPDQIVWRIGSRGAKVAQIQTIVGASPDGVYGRETAAKVRAWQLFLGFADSDAGGVWGPATEKATQDLFDALASGVHLREPVYFRDGPDQNICDLQALLGDNGYDFDGDRFTCVDDEWTNNIVVDFKAKHGLETNNVVDSFTWAELGQTGR